MSSKDGKELSVDSFNENLVLPNFLFFYTVFIGILMTGINGFLGRQLVDALIADLDNNFNHPFSIFGIDNFIKSIE